MTMHLRVDQAFVQDETWEASYEAYLGFFRRMENQKGCLLGIGCRIQYAVHHSYPFEKMTESISKGPFDSPQS